MQNSKRIFAAFLGATLFGGVIVGQASGVILRDSRYDLCPVESGKVLSPFALEHADQVRAAVPMMGRSPELERGDPAYLVAFAGPVQVPVLGGPPHPEGEPVAGPKDGLVREYSGVVCVVVDGHAIVYTDVDLTGLRAP